MKTNLIGAFFLFGAFQSLLLLVVLNRKPSRSHLPNKFLTALLGCIAALLVHHGICALTPQGSFYSFMDLAAAVWFAIPPLICLFIQSLTQPNFQLKTWHLLYFTLPVYNLLQWGLHGMGLYVGFYWLFDSIESYTYAWVSNYILSGLFFLGLAVYRLRSAVFPPKQQARVRWIVWYLMVFLGALGVASLLLAFSISAKTYSENYEYSLLFLFETFVLILAFKSMSFSSYFSQLQNNTYKLSREKVQDLENIHQKLKAYMEQEQPYLRGDLNLPVLASETGFSENSLSQVFSQHLKTNFYDFVNGYRLEAFEKTILQPENRQYKIASLAEECGFGSKASFYKAFREKHQMTPTQYLKLHQ